MSRPPKQERTEFGERLYQARTALGLTQEQVAAELGITQNAYSQWERLPKSFQPEQIKRLSEILKTSPNDLIGG